MSALTLGGGGSVELGASLAKAGEGTVFEVADRPEWAAKVFHADLAGLEEKLGKVAAMARSIPDGAVQSDGFTVLAWPLDVVSDDTGPVGFVMRRIDTATAVEIHSISNPSNRMDPSPSAPQWTKNATWSHLVNVAANLCLAVEIAHRADAVIGDFQERNILVSDTTQVSLVDCDSMQFTDTDGRQFLCGVGRPEFTAPELANVDLATTVRGTPSDLFALAVHIHLLLMGGNHPFLRGTWTGPGDQPESLTLAQFGHWAGGTMSSLHTHPLAPPPSFLPGEIQRLFARAFTDGVRDPALRPSAAEWRAALLRIRMTGCTRQAAHQIPVGCPTCPWCAIDDERTHRKPRQQPPSQTISKVAPPSKPAAKRAPPSKPAAKRAPSPKPAAKRAPSPKPAAKRAPPQSASAGPAGGTAGSSRGWSLRRKVLIASIIVFLVIVGAYVIRATESADAFRVVQAWWKADAGSPVRVQLTCTRDRGIALGDS